jgi:hypothetical protein
MSFKGDLEKFEVGSIGDAQLFIRRAALEIYRGVVLKSPVDTGRFRANWNVSLGVNDYSTTTYTSAKGPVDETELAKANAVLKMLTGDGSAFISNGLPYAARLETGYSNQAPFGMVDVTLVEFNNFIGKQIATQI